MKEPVVTPTSPASGPRAAGAARPVEATVPARNERRVRRMAQGSLARVRLSMKNAVFLVPRALKSM